MHTFSKSALLLAVLCSIGAQADDDGLSLQQQRDRIGEEMIRERTGNPPADANGTDPSTIDQQQQTPRSTLNSPARQRTGNGTEPGTDKQRQPSGNAPTNGIQSPPRAPVGSPVPATPGTGGNSQGPSGAIAQ